MISSVAMLVLIIMSFCIIFFYSRDGNDDWSAAQLLAEILCIRDDDFRVLFSDGGRLLTSELNLYYHILRRVVLNFFKFLCVVLRVRF